MYHHLFDEISLIKTSEHANSIAIDDYNMENIDNTNENNENWQSMKVLNLLTPPKDGKEANSYDNSKLFQFANNASWLVNWFLLGAKLYCVIVSSSKAVTAALVDSIVDLVSQFILTMSDRYISKHSPDYPVGRSRLEALSVIACAFIMSMASIEVIQYASIDLYNGLMGHLPSLDVTTTLYVIMAVGIVLKFFLWLFCLRINAILQSDTITALAEDHFNDVISNTGAVITVAIAFHTVAWWVDPVGAIIISLVIIYRWIGIISEQVKKIVGHTAPPEYIEEIEQLALNHDPRLFVDCSRVYHFGARYNVEMEIVLPGNMTVMESHDIALALQHKIESMEDVERAFVHVDHQKRDGLEHKIERELVNNSATTISTPTTPINNSNATIVEPPVMNELRLRATANQSSPTLDSNNCNL